MSANRRVVCLCALLSLAAGGASAQTPQQDVRVADLRAKLGRELNQIASTFDGAIGIAVRDLTTNEMLAVNADTVFPQASSIKIAVLLEVLGQAQAGTLKLGERIEVKRAAMAPGSGVLQDFGDATSALAIRDLATLMIVLSDNSATNILIDRVGMAHVNERLAALRLNQTRLERRMMDKEAERAGVENLSTPRDMTLLLDQLYHGKALDAAHTTLALDILKIPKPEGTPLSRGLPAGLSLADKKGELDGVRCDSGIVLLAGRPYAISVMTTYARDEEAAERAISEVSRRVFAYFERLARSNAHGVRVQ